jgi:hypothetical protein
MKKSLKFFLVLLGLFELSCAGVLNTVDSKQKNNLALAGNPAVSAVNKQKEIGFQANFLTKYERSGNILDYGYYWKSRYGISYTDMRNKFKDSASNWSVGLVGDYADNWFSLSYAVDTNYQMAKYYESTIYDIYGTPLKRSYLNTDTILLRVETTTLGWARDFNWFTGGIQLSFVSGTEKNKSRATNVYNETNQPHPIDGEIEYDLIITKPYTLIAVGLEKNLFVNQKLLLAHKFSGEMNKTHITWSKYADGSVMYERSSDGNSHIGVPAETALGYVYKINNDLELAAACTKVWGLEYTRIWAEFTKYESEIDEVRLPYDIYGAVISWRAWRPILELQTYVNYAKDVGAGSVDHGYDVVDLPGVTSTQLGLTAVYTPDEQQVISLSILRDKLEALFESYEAVEKYTGEVAYSYRF